METVGKTRDEGVSNDDKNLRNEAVTSTRPSERHKRHSSHRKHRTAASSDPYEVVERSDCVFCRICDKVESEDKILFENDEFIVFPTIRPAAKFHHLVVTKVHIKNCESLTYDQLDLLERMVNIGKQVFGTALQNSIDDADAINSNTGETEEDIPTPLMGFHFPPHNTVHHIHLHVIYPTNTPEFMARRRYRPNTYWFVSPEYVKNRILDKLDKKQNEQENNETTKIQETDSLPKTQN